MIVQLSVWRFTSSLDHLMSRPMWIGRLLTASQPSSNNSCSGGSTAGSHVCMWKITCSKWHIYSPCHERSR